MNTRNKKNVFPHVILALCVCTMIGSCKEEESEEVELVGNWIELSDFEGVTRCDAVAFSIGDKGYVGTGYDGGDRLCDFWEYDPARDTWMQKADFPGGGRNSAVGIGTDTKGYVGTGYNGLEKLNDFWEYDPDSNRWAQKAEFGGSPRYGAIGFSINNKCYIGTGFDGNYLKDFWEYDPQQDVWEQKVSVGGSKRRDAAAFVINGKGYICTGINNGTYEDDFWEYDPESGMWEEKNAISDATDDDFDDDYTYIIGISKVGFALNGKGYLATGGTSVSVTVWEYDPIADLWEQKTSVEGTARIDAVGFSIGNMAYITTGRSSSYYFDDLWAFSPDDKYNEED